MGHESCKDILDLLKKGDMIEVQKKLMELQESSLELKKENIYLKNKLLEIEEKIRKLSTHKGSPCPKCAKTVWIVESSRPDDEFGDLGSIRREYKCQECNYTEFVLINPK